MLLGMAMLKSGFLTGAWHRPEYLRIARLGYLAGGVPMIGLAYWCWSSDFEILATFNAVMSWSLPFRVPLTIAHAALLMWLVLRFANSSMIERIAAAGRAAFTNYVGASIILRSEEHTSELQSLMRISYAVFCLKNKTTPTKK